MLHPLHRHPSGTTFSEVLIAILLLAFFFVSIFELNAICLRYIDASKESVAASQMVQDRSEALRNLAFIDLTSAPYLQGLLASPANGSDFAKSIMEVVKISQYPTPNGVTQLTRGSSGRRFVPPLNCQVMRKAFDVESGPLTDLTAPRAEREAHRISRPTGGFSSTSPRPGTSLHERRNSACGPAREGPQAR